MAESFPQFEREPRAWVFAMMDRLMQPGVALVPKDRAYVVRQREIMRTDEERVPGGNIKEALCRMARRYSIMAKQRHATALRSAHRAEVARVQAVRIPPAHAVGAPIPRPPPLRRPVVALGGGQSETWDPSVGGV